MDVICNNGTDNNSTQFFGTPNNQREWTRRFFCIGKTQLRLHRKRSRTAERIFPTVRFHDTTLTPTKQTTTNPPLQFSVFSVCLELRRRRPRDFFLFTDNIGSTALPPLFSVPLHIRPEAKGATIHLCKRPLSFPMAAALRRDNDIAGRERRFTTPGGLVLPGRN